MSKFRITYEATLDTGNLAPQALVEYLQELEKDSPNFSVWEVFNDTIQMTTIELLDEK